jgi:ATP-dependent DNA helicase DinG
MKQADASFDIYRILSPDGAVARSLAGFEQRSEQVEMAGAIGAAFDGTGHLVVEAGTGVGKSFAYLIPAIERIGRRAGEVLVSTFTITLQEQLINKDIPFLAEVLPVGFTAVLAKGRGNYLCKRRLDFAFGRRRLLFDKFGDELSVIKRWAEQTEDGSLSDIPVVPKKQIWDAVSSEHGNCRGRRCRFFRDCFYQRARRRLDSADIIVANHALMFSDLVLKEAGVSLLGEYRYVIVDEAHNIEHVAEEHFGINISNYTVKFLLDGLYNPRTGKGLLAYRGPRTKTERAIDLVGAIGRGARNFFKRVSKWYQENKDETGGRCYKNFVDDNVSGHLKNLRAELGKLAKASEDIDEKFEFLHFADRCSSLVGELGCFLAQERGDYVYWVEPAGGARGGVRLRSAPLNVGEDVKRCLFDKFESVILTSATLSSGAARDEEGFDFFAGRVGLEDFEGLKLGSPFDYERQVTMYIEKDLPNPNDDAFVEAAAEAIKKYVKQTAGRAFVLFTSYEMLDAMADKLSGWLGENDIELLEQAPKGQGAGLDRGVLLRRFKSQASCVLFGTDSFWQGVDVPGEALSNVIIVRLPFAVPDQPLLAGRLEQIKERGGDPFVEYQLPSAIIKFKQGFGRLIRHKSDTGIVVILDSRIINKRYGQKFLAAVPKCKTEIVSGG